MKATLIVVGLLIATAGGVIAYRAFFLEPSAAVIITNTTVRQLPNYSRVAGGLVLLVLGAAIAFLAVRLRK